MNICSVLHFVHSYEVFAAGFLLLFHSVRIQTRDCDNEFAHMKWVVLYYFSEVPVFLNKCFVQSGILYEN